MKKFKLVFKIISVLVAITTIIFVSLYFFDDKKSSYLIVAVILALTISVLQIVNIILTKVFTLKHEDKTHNQE